MLRLTGLAMLLIATDLVAAAPAEKINLTVNAASTAGAGAPLGTIVFRSTRHGLRVTYHVVGLTPGAHGMHIHAGGTCAPGLDKSGKVIAAGAAGGHYDPGMTDKHMGPEGMGHLGDLPFITADSFGHADGAVSAPHITDFNALHGHVLVIHAGGDNYADSPAPLGGGGARVACAIIP
ncbi:MAG: superoxide dismutase family protein [Alphaproteobacteria bacterium]|nr:superoxide dismutase family protein [Alphaproteobacteria bacterium]